VDECRYRPRPSKKTRPHSALGQESATQHSETDDPRALVSPMGASKKARHDPNPGYLGSSSHTTFFDHLSGNDHNIASSTSREEQDTPLRTLGCVATDEKFKHGASLITQIRTSIQLSAWASLILAWVDKGINLPVAETFTVYCAQTVERVFNSSEGNNGFEDNDTISRRLFYSFTSL
jgi:hypothetical protein